MAETGDDGRKVSRQTLWQRRRKAEGRCIQCGSSDLKNNTVCAKCQEKFGRWQNRQVSKGIYRSKYNNKGRWKQ